MANPGEKDRREPDEEPERGEHNRLGYYNADEERTHDESPGPQGTGTGDSRREEE
jgi:hypothetical protein